MPSARDRRSGKGGGRRSSEGRSSGGSRTSTSRGQRNGRASGGGPGYEPVLDAESRRDIFGIALTATAIALTIAMLARDTGFVAEIIAGWLRTLFGLSSYALPLGLLVWGLSFFVRTAKVNEVRVAAGLGVSLLALAALLSLPAPLEDQWSRSILVTHGGYLGGVMAWALRTTVGTAISYVVLAALLLIGVVVTGVSISSAVTRALERRRSAAEERETLRTSRSRAPKTQPLEDLAEPVRERAHGTSRRERRPQTDPETRRATAPTPGVTAPKAMEGFVLPPLDVLRKGPERTSEHRASDRELRQTAELIVRTLGTFDIQSRVTGWVPGPTVTMFEVEPAKGVKVNKITALTDDIALALAAPTIRILAPIPGKSLIGIEVPNDLRATVFLRDVLPQPSPGASPLLLAVGKDVSGDNIVADLATMPHLLIAGATGMGKSVCINALLMSILMRATPAEVRLILIDPKRIEMSHYNGLGHLYVPVVTEAKQAASALAWAVNEMESRLKRLQKSSAKNISAYNALVHSGDAPEGAEEMPYIVVVIDELADLMMVAAREVEDSIVRLAQLARAAGIHLIVATQRPSTDIITGLIKTNITSRIAFAVSSGIDSRVILDQPGAERLVGDGDMLFSTPAWAKPKRIQGAFVSEEEISAIVRHVRGQAEPEYHEEILHTKVGAAAAFEAAHGEDDPLLWEAADILVGSGLGSTSLLQRRLKVGYARAGRIMDMLEANGVVGPPDGSKPREVLVDEGELEALIYRRTEDDEGDDA